MKGCGNKFMKYFLIAINTIFLLVGLLLAGMAGYAAFNKHSAIHQFIIGFNVQNIVTGLYIMMAVGLFLALVSFLGCFGAATENRCLLATYFGIVLIIVILQLSAIILCFVKYKSLKKSATALLQSTSNTHQSQLLIAGLNLIQPQMQCCGLNGPHDWYLRQIPESCYAHVSVHHGKLNGLMMDSTNTDTQNSENIRLQDSDLHTVAIPIENNSSTAGAVVTPIGAIRTNGKATGSDKSTSGGASSARATGGSAGASASSSTTVAKVATASTVAAAAATSEKIPTKAAVVAATTIAPTKGAVATTTLGTTTTKTFPSVIYTTAKPIRGHLYKTGCLTMLKPAFYAAGAIGIVVLFLEIAVLVFACLMYSNLKHGYDSIA